MAYGCYVLTPPPSPLAAKSIEIVNQLKTLEDVHLMFFSFQLFIVACESQAIFA